MALVVVLQPQVCVLLSNNMVGGHSQALEVVFQTKVSLQLHVVVVLAVPGP
jgi:hypothetical protein